MLLLRHRLYRELHLSRGEVAKETKDKCLVSFPRRNQLLAIIAAAAGFQTHPALLQQVNHAVGKRGRCGPFLVRK
jgi:hypothetical protein